MNRNYEAIIKKYPALKDKYLEMAEQEYKDENKMVYIDVAADGNDIVTFQIDGKYRYINSRYEPGKEACTWAEQFSDINPLGIVILFGLGNGIHVREMLKVLGETNVVLIVEPSPAMFRMVVSEFDISDIISDKRVILEVQGISDGVYNESLAQFVTYSNFKLARFVALPNYSAVFPEEYVNMYKKYKAQAELIIMSRNTQIKYSGEFIQNILRNYKDIVNQSTINNLRDEFVKHNVQDVPAIIVSAGPSLDKNIQDLKAAEGKCFLIVVDTALKPVLNAGITPDISIIVDPHKPLILFDHEKIKEVPMVAWNEANHKVLERQKAPIFYFAEPNQYINYIYNKYSGRYVDGLDTGGSVAHNAFSLAWYLGFRTIILVGQDLAFSGNKSHVANAYTKRVDRNLMLESCEACMVEDIHGNMVETMKNMELYLRWFEKQFDVHKELRVIDATEGGAKKKGTAIMTLKDAIEEECRREFNASEIISSVKKAFSDEAIEKIYEEFRDIPNQIEIFKKKMDEGIRDYYRFDELYRKGKTSGAEFGRILEKIKQVNGGVDNEPLIDLISQYNAIDNYEIAGDMFEFKDNEKDEIKEIVSRGIRMLESYKRAADKLSGDIYILLNDIG